MSVLKFLISAVHSSFHDRIGSFEVLNAGRTLEVTTLKVHREKEEYIQAR
jgi:hypothetical protein